MGPPPPWLSIVDFCSSMRKQLNCSTLFSAALAAPAVPQHCGRLLNHQPLKNCSCRLARVAAYGMLHMQCIADATMTSSSSAAGYHTTAWAAAASASAEQCLAAGALGHAPHETLLNSVANQ
jgi:hypothetical protein